MALKTHGTMESIGNSASTSIASVASAGKSQGSAGEVRNGRAALFRHEQCALPTRRTLARGPKTRPTDLPAAAERRAILWDFGSAAKHQSIELPVVGERSRPGISMLRGAMTPEMGRAEDVAKNSH